MQIYLKTYRLYILVKANSTMTNLVSFQNALNKVVHDITAVNLEGFVTYLVEKSKISEDMERMKSLVNEYQKEHPVNVFNFGPKRKEKKTRPPNSYNLFIKEKMHEIKEANPELKGKELLKRATQEWNKQKEQQKN